MSDPFTFSTNRELYELFPEAKVGVLYINGLQPLDSEEDLTNAIANTVEAIAKQNDPATKRREVEKWQQAFELLGLNSRDALPSHVSLLKRALGTKQLLRINPIVDAYNLISLKHLVPIGGHDLEEIKQIWIGKTTGKELFKTMNSDEKGTPVQANEFAYLDDKDRVLTRNLVWRQSDYSKVSKTTTRLLIPIDDIVNVKSARELEQIAYEIVGLLQGTYSFKWSFGVVSKYNSEIVLNGKKQIDLTDKVRILHARPDIDTSDEAISKFVDRKIDEIYPSKDDLVSALKSGKRLSFYIGADATAPRLHLGHLIPVQKMSQLQQMGHKVIFLIGDFTAKIGDPTDKSATRVMLTDAEVAHNASHFREQISPYIDFEGESNPAEVVFNSHWNSDLSFSDVIRLASSFTVQQMLERDMFKKRLKENKPIYLHEFLYPLMQGYDSVFMEVDGEFGGRDQTFNMLAGRQMAKAMKGLNKFVITTHFLLSADGVSKMSKSIGNCIFISDTPEDKFGKVMSIPDNLISHYYELATFIADDQLNRIKGDLEGGSDPMTVKKEVAFQIVKLHHGEEEATKAQSYFEKTIQNQEAPEDIREVSREELRNINGSDKLELKVLLVETGLAPSNTEAKRLIQAGAVEIDGSKQIDASSSINLSEINTVKVGKRGWIKLV
ncbi:MAG: tyrosine--tRNA ligase [Candidatus Dojkabacteria bacterium]